MLRVIRGVPTPEELAALVGVLALRRGSAPAATRATTRAGGHWRASALPAAGWRPGSGAWRASALPR